MLKGKIVYYLDEMTRWEEEIKRRKGKKRLSI